MISPILVTAGLSLTLFVTGFFAFLTPLPIALGFFRRGPLSASGSFLLSLVSLAALYLLPSAPLAFLPVLSFQETLGFRGAAVLSLLLYFYYGWIGLTLGYVSRRNESMEKGILRMLISSLLVPGLLLAVLAIGTGLHPLGELKEGLSRLMDRVIELEQKSGLEGEEVFFLKENASAIISQVIGLAPSLCILMTFFLVSLNTFLMRRWKALENTFPGWGDFSLWRLGERAIWIPIGGGVLFFLNHYLFRRAVLEQVVLNLLLVMASVYFFQGISILIYFFRRRFPPLMRMAVYLMILLFLQLVGVLIVVLGLFDFWFDFRKLKKVA